ncbi:trypsin-like serine peptidase [Streptomyces sp. NPDC101206]|uniref:trypsin-like serine peptidase n=1 Tax=Streptomyces sp. NPDC101206 TaxID=3366128 RepID=UPI003817979F
MSDPIPSSDWEDRITARPAARPGDPGHGHSFPPRPETVRVTPAHLSALDREVSHDLDGHLPEGVPVRAVPRPVPPEQVRPPLWRRPAGVEGDDRGEATGVFRPDDRFEFSDTSFPWRTCGRVQTPAGWASGVMVGPRHLLTASHAVPWLASGGSDWMTFTPSQFDTSTPFGTANSTRVYSWLRAHGADGIDSTEAAFDYVVCVLDRRLGDTVGWMGSRTYSTDWDAKPLWGHVGYPFDIGSGVRPVYHPRGVMDRTVAESTAGRDSYRIVHRNDAVGGQSGGPFFGWWDGDPWPRVVAGQSAENWGGPGGPNAAGGGSALPVLIDYARSVEP